MAFELRVRDILRRCGRNDTAMGLCAGESDLDRDVARDQVTVGEYRSHLGGAECVPEQRGVEDGCGSGK